MNRHELDPDDQPEATQWARVEKSRTVEVKVVAATAATLLASVAFAVLDALAHHTEIFDALPEWLRFVVLAAIPPVLTFLAGYAVPSNRV
jgi:hypothetical protein